MESNQKPPAGDDLAEDSPCNRSDCRVTTDREGEDSTEKAAGGSDCGGQHPPPRLRNTHHYHDLAGNDTLSSRACEPRTGEHDYLPDRKAVAAHGRMMQPPRLLASQLECAGAGWTRRHGLIGSDQVRRSHRGG
jgi:hypothetical protein